MKWMHHMMVALLLAALIAGCGSAPADTEGDPPEEQNPADVSEPEPEPEPEPEFASPEETRAALERLQESLATFESASWYNNIEDLSLYISEFGWDINVETSLWDKPSNIETGKNICRAVLNSAVSANATPLARVNIGASNGGYVVSCRAEMSSGRLESPMEFY